MVCIIVNDQDYSLFCFSHLFHQAYLKSRRVGGTPSRSLSLQKKTEIAHPNKLLIYAVHTEESHVNSIGKSASRH